MSQALRESLPVRVTGKAQFLGQAINEADVSYIAQLPQLPALGFRNMHNPLPQLSDSDSVNLSTFDLRYLPVARSDGCHF